MVKQNPWQEQKCAAKSSRCPRTNRWLQRFLFVQQKQVVRQQLQTLQSLVGSEVLARELVNRKSAFGFLDVILGVPTVVIKMPHIFGVPVNGGRLGQKLFACHRMLERFFDHLGLEKQADILETVEGIEHYVNAKVLRRLEALVNDIQDHPDWWKQLTVTDEHE